MHFRENPDYAMAAICIAGLLLTVGIFLKWISK